MYLGIDDNTGLVYEGAGAPNIPSIPTPAVTQATLVERIGEWGVLPHGLSSDAFRWVFREDSFDPVSRVRRGRLYQPHMNMQPHVVIVAPSPYDPTVRWQGAVEQRKSLFVYAQCAELLNMPSRGLGAILALGSAQAASFWRIVQTEMLVNRAVMVTLKALSAYDILPELDATQVADEFVGDVNRALEKVLDAAFRESPDSVVDRCRNALTVVMSRWLAQRGHPESVLTRDLGDVSDAISKPPYEKFCPANMGRTVAQLHNRTKENVMVHRGLRPLVDEDAEFALQAVGLTLRDLGWAKANEFPVVTRL